MTIPEHGFNDTRRLMAYPPIPHPSAPAHEWVSDIVDGSRSSASRQGKFVAINDLVLFAPAEIPHLDVYRQAMHEEYPDRDAVLEQIEIIRSKGLQTLKSAFVTDAGMFGIYSAEGTSGDMTVELRDKSYHFGRADFLTRTRTVDRVRQNLADIGLGDIEVRNSH